MDLALLRTMAASELTAHGLHDWTFRLTTTKRRLGACKYRHKQIEIAGYYAVHNPESSVRDTLLHEIAHALAGPTARHGPVWKAIATRIGATPHACDTSPDTVVAPGDWQTTCPACRRTFHRYQRPKRLTGYRCKCPAGSPLTFAFAGDPHQIPVVAPPRPAPWQAPCPGCGTLHQRVRKPKPGVWRCRCPQRSELVWRFVGR